MYAFCMAPIIGITADIIENKHCVGIAYSNAIQRAGGTPLVLPPVLGCEDAYIERCDGFVFSGGDDPIMEVFGEQTHPKATKVHEQRQAFELSLLAKLQLVPDAPVFGVCLGMQYLGLQAGATLIQHLDDEMLNRHKKGEHKITSEFGNGVVHTHHHQALADAGSLEVIARSEDGLIEGIADKQKPWYIGVQWHPERTEHSILGQAIFNDFVAAAT
ncbi:MAG: gamma-glutamyl-gamma-aminobutyrate hydrolase family protein [Planctomycetota bacterium]|nr:gamma-glutamyl-gamma-aminobutyrate hydrolase family protein [Planctomycetota bacterium]